MTPDDDAVAQAEPHRSLGFHRADDARGSDQGSAKAVPGHRAGRTAAFAVIVVGALAAGTLAGSVLSSAPRFELAQVETADLDAATPSVPPAEAATHIADAKACRVPMAVLTLRPHPGQAGTVRIRSGDYWSPSIRLASETLRVAIPFPAPYEAARGDLVIEGGGSADYDVFLRPGWVSAGRLGPTVLHVWWTPKQPC